MKYHTPYSSNSTLPYEVKQQFWPDLRRVVSTSSGYQRWVLERGLDANASGPILDNLVRSYLRQTLETLAY